MSETTALREPETRAVTQYCDPVALIQSALGAGVNASELGELYALVRQMQADEAKRKYSAALAAFQRECPPIHKARKTGGNMAFTFASLDDIDKVIRPILAKYGIVPTFNPRSMADGVIKGSLRLHVGEWHEDFELDCPVPKEMRVNDTQKMGAALTYARRYVLCAALNIVVTDEDVEAANLDGVIDADQITEIELLLRDTKADVGKFLKWAGATEVADIPQAKYAEAVRMLRAKKGGAK